MLLAVTVVLYEQLGEPMFCVVLAARCTQKFAATSVEYRELANTQLELGNRLNRAELVSGTCIG